jgi:hypothetical protein
MVHMKRGSTGWRSYLLPSESRANRIARRIFIIAGTLVAVGVVLSAVTTIVGTDAVQWASVLLFWAGLIVAIPALGIVIATGKGERRRPVA